MIETFIFWYGVVWLVITFLVGFAIVFALMMELLYKKLRDGGLVMEFLKYRQQKKGEDTERLAH